MRNSLTTGEALTKVSLLADTGVDVSAFHTIEYDIHVEDEHALSAMMSDVLLSAPSTYAKRKPLKSQTLHSCRLRVNSYLFARNMDITVFWVNDLARKHNAFVYNWRVVLKP
jgi:hypothetical protein